MPQDWAPSNWSESHARNVAQQISKLRGDRSAQWLSDRTSDLGYRVNRATIADIENGRRRYVTTAELVILAAALNTSPVALLFPGPDYQSEVEALPGRADRKIDVVQWFSGISSVGYTDLANHPDGPGAAGRESARLRSEYQENTRELRLWRELLEVYRRISSVRIPLSGNVSEDKKHLLDLYSDQVHSLRMQLGLEDEDGG
ncbi:hypothetical protein [Mycolicibacterium iranicum]|uniref:HTH cro/C1-type domain-containing protein n=1 Tax=Mycolicibacterium iranicum TaxID=912594 RepID=A0ABT4HPR2_MYCIR|nr:hypothetical protein [Mycolicibacterium iranicum]MCZ0732223.1 hypothetical protein [Mycolicibacterium iranicum]